MSLLDENILFTWSTHITADTGQAVMRCLMLVSDILEVLEAHDTPMPLLQIQVFVQQLIAESADRAQRDRCSLHERLCA